MPTLSEATRVGQAIRQSGRSATAGQSSGESKGIAMSADELHPQAPGVDATRFESEEQPKLSVVGESLELAVSKLREGASEKDVLASVEQCDAFKATDDQTRERVRRSVRFLCRLKPPRERGR